MGTPLTGASNAGGVWKNLDFWLIARLISEMIQDSQSYYVIWIGNHTQAFEWYLSDLQPRFKITPLFDAENLRNGTRRNFRRNFNGILIGTYTRPTQQCHFEWPWVILSDLVEYSMTRSIARSLRQLSFLFCGCYQTLLVQKSCQRSENNWSRVYLVVADTRHVRRLFLDGGDVLCEGGPAPRNSVGRQHTRPSVRRETDDRRLELIDAHVPLLRVFRERLSRVGLVVTDDVRQSQPTTTCRRRRRSSKWK